MVTRGAVGVVVKWLMGIQGRTCYTEMMAHYIAPLNLVQHCVLTNWN